ncbi:hypothetical protein [Brucella pseudogrignonensis]|uniref:hypothetical protein n=1 Tax=Brucella pseudogrignonensis TaxID=419475 RepID=UPI000CFE1233|nr:hypothetical protein [Brucella pseudogrignonensis]MQP42364.1 hypothetical protein [Ochrobactrum sp. MYb237]PQZ44054.1 hypothetical protein CQ059_09300 [Brucella pseudogrignonensis]PRA38306.1 hypothetical protein CQ063_19205 [Brucella pseudogrignonensis]PRA64149.1 hypothetical protein CQ055_19095 [Brucella pseudogrignonensis]
MTKHTKPTFTEIRKNIAIPERKKPGIKSYASDERLIEMAINGIRSGKYKSINNAAEIIADERSENDNYEAMKRRLVRKISATTK